MKNGRTIENSDEKSAQPTKTLTFEVPYGGAMRGEHEILAQPTYHDPMLTGASEY